MRRARDGSLSLKTGCCLGLAGRGDEKDTEDSLAAPKVFKLSCGNNIPATTCCCKLLMA